MNPDIDPIDAYFAGVTKPIIFVAITFGIMWLACLTHETANFPEIKGFSLILGPLTGFAAMGFWMTYGSVAMIGLISLIGTFVGMFLLIKELIRPKIGLFVIYAGSIIYFFPIAWEGERWWVPVLLFTTVSLYYWFAIPLFQRQRERLRELNDDY